MTTEQAQTRHTELARRARRDWIKPGGLACAGEEGPIVECMSYEEDPTGVVNVRMTPGQATTARLVPAAGLRQLTCERMTTEADTIADSIRFVAGDTRASGSWQGAAWNMASPE